MIRNLDTILYITYDGLLDQLGTSQILPYLEGLANGNMSIHILSVEKKERSKSEIKDLHDRLSAKGIAWSFIYFESSHLGKITNLNQLLRQATAIVKQKSVRLIHARSYIAAEIALKLKKIYRIPYLFDIRGFWIDERVERGIWNLWNPVRRYAYHHYRRMEPQLYENASGIVTLTQASAQIIQEKFKLAKKPLEVIPCAADFNLFRPVNSDKLKGLRKELQIPENTYVVSYLGSLGGVYNTIQMLQFFKQIRKQKPAAIFLVLTAEPAEKVMESARLAKVDPAALRVLFSPRERLNDYLNLSTVNIFFLSRSFSLEASVPTKLGEVWAAGIPVICNDFGDMKSYFSDNPLYGKLLDSTSKDYALDFILPESLEMVQRKLIREHASDIFDLTSAVDKYSRIYTRIV